MNECKHEPDLAAITPQHGTPGRATTTCQKCGAGGEGWVELHEIDWDEQLGADVDPDYEAAMADRA